jgi:hypothetical protein
MVFSSRGPCLAAILDLPRPAVDRNLSMLTVALKRKDAVLLTRGKDVRFEVYTAGTMKNGVF